MARPTRPPRSSRAFGLDAEQTDAILELKVYRLARLEILIIRRELADKRERQAEIIALLGDEPARWALVRSEIAEVQKIYSDTRADRRRTTFASDDEVVEYDAEAFIIEEDNVVVVSRDGWIKRQKEVKDPATTRLREGDEILAAVGGSTRATLVLFTTLGVAYTCRFIDVPASTGYGEPVQRFFKFKDGERVVAVMSLDPRVSPGLQPKAEGETPPRHALAAILGRLRVALQPGALHRAEHARRTQVREAARWRRGRRRRAGDRRGDDHRRDARGAGDAVRGRRSQRALGSGRGVILIKIDGAKDRLLGFIASRGDRDLMVVETSRGAEQTISTAKYEVTARGGKGRELLQRGSFTRVVPPPPQVIGGAGIAAGRRLTSSRMSRMRRLALLICVCRRRPAPGHPPAPAADKGWLVGTASRSVLPTVDGGHGYAAPERLPPDADADDPGVFAAQFDQGPITVGNGKDNAHWVRDDLRVRTFAIQRAGTDRVVVIAAADVYMVFRPDAEELRRMVREVLPPERQGKVEVLVHATHNHHGPDTAFAVNPDWYRFFLEQTRDAVKEAVERLEPATLRVAEGTHYFGGSDLGGLRVFDPDARACCRPAPRTGA